MDRSGSKPKDRKKVLCSELAAAVRKLQEELVISKPTSSRASEPQPGQAEQLCEIIESIFLHELKNTKGELWRETRQANSWNVPEPSFWIFVDPLISDDIKMKLYALRNSESNIRKCRSWVRLMISSGLMLTFMEDLQRHPGLLAFHYGINAVLRDPEQSEVIIQLLKGLSVFQLECDHTSSRLCTWEPFVLQLAGVWMPPKRMLSQESRAGSTRISPPASDFDFEGVSLIDMALHRYTKRKADKLSDAQLIKQEQLEQLTATSDESRGSGSTTSLDGTATTPDRSYGALLRSYTRKSTTAMSGSEALDIPGHSGAIGEGRGYDLSLAVHLNYEVVSSNGSLASELSDTHQQHIQTMTSLLTTLVPEKGLDSQDYLCASCKRPIGVIFGQAKLCRYSGQHYCFDCHVDDERIVPSRVLFNWDFRKHGVCVASCEFLDSIECTPVLNVQEANKVLYMYIPELEEVLQLRQKLTRLKDYLLTCKDRDVAEKFMKRMQSSHLYENEHLYSLHDLVEVHSGALVDRLKRALKFGLRHIKQCTLCSQKGFICEVCRSDQVIFPFQLDWTYQCSKCHALYHKTCQLPKRKCPKCVRLHQRMESLQSTDADS